MLSHRESEVMNAVYSLCHESGICLISPSELLALLPHGKRYSETELERILNELSFDNYFQLLSSERKGEKMYVISMRANGFAFKRGAVQRKRGVVLKLFWTVASAIIAFLVGVILRRLF